LLYDEELVRKWYNIESRRPDSIKQRLTGWYLRRHVDKLFACSDTEIKSEEQETEIIPFHIDEEDLEKTLSQINNVEKPVMVIGSQTMIKTEEVDNLANAVADLGIPVYLTGMARGLLGKDHSLYFRHNRSKVLKEADLVILAGMPQDFRLNYGRSMNPKAYLISINRSWKELKKNRKPDLAIQADSSYFLQMLVQEEKLGKDFNEWIKILRDKEKEQINEIEQFMNEKTDGVNPLKLCQDIESVINEDSIIIVDGGDFIATASYIVKPTGPLKWIDAGPFGTLGTGAGFALTAKLLNPKSEVWLLYGDGAAGYSVAEFDTFVRHNIPIIAIIGNDAGWTQIQRDQVKYLGDDVATTLLHNDYHKVAKGYGAEGLLVNDPEDVSRILNEAKNICKKGKPVLVNALIGKNDFREGSISM
jgi:thiamine pyrophosphate-dependent acetolactate synthase large subunit-like protein